MQQPRMFFEKEQSRNNDTTDLKTFYITIVIKIDGYWSKYRQLDQQRGMDFKNTTNHI